MLQQEYLYDKEIGECFAAQLYHSNGLEDLDD